MNCFLISIHRFRILLAISPAPRIPNFQSITSSVHYITYNVHYLVDYYYLCVFGCFRAVGMTSIILDDAPLLCCLQLFSLFSWFLCAASSSSHRHNRKTRYRRRFYIIHRDEIYPNYMMDFIPIISSSCCIICHVIIVMAIVVWYPSGTQFSFRGRNQNRLPATTTQRTPASL